MQFNGILLALLVALVSSASVAAGDDLVIELDKASLTGGAAEASPGLTNVARGSVPMGVPRTLRLPLTVAGDGTTSFSLRQEAVDGPVDAESGTLAIRVRVLSPSLGTVTDDARGSLSIGMSTTIAFDNLATGESRIFDVTIRGDTRADTPYGSGIPIHVEGWRRGEDAKPVENPTAENRSFWGTVSARFERSE